MKLVRIEVERPGVMFWCEGCKAMHYVPDDAFTSIKGEWYAPITKAHPSTDGKACWFGLTIPGEPASAESMGHAKVTYVDPCSHSLLGHHSVADLPEPDRAWEAKIQAEVNERTRLRELAERGGRRAS